MCLYERMYGFVSFDVCFCFRLVHCLCLLTDVFVSFSIFIFVSVYITVAVSASISLCVSVCACMGSPVAWRSGNPKSGRRTAPTAAAARSVALSRSSQTFKPSQCTHKTAQHTVHKSARTRRAQTVSRHCPTVCFWW